MDEIPYCQICGKAIKKFPNQRYYTPKACRGKCRSELNSRSHKGLATRWMKGKTAWNKGKKVPALSGKKNPAWKGGIVKHMGGYTWVRVEGKYILEHRLIMEKFIGRKLIRQEVIHHINGIKTDNRIENLMLMTQSDHMKLHKKIKKNHLTNGLPD